MIVKLKNKQGLEITCKTLDSKEDKNNYFKSVKEIGKSPFPFIYNHEGKNIVVYEVLDKEDQIKDLNKIVLINDTGQYDKNEDLSSSFLQGKEKQEFIYELSSEIHGLFQYCDKCQDETRHKTEIKKAICCICGYSYELN